MRCATNLELLDIRYCKESKTCVINAAIDITKKRTNNLTLEIWIAEKQIDFEKIEGKSRLLHLELYV